MMGFEHKVLMEEHGDLRIEWLKLSCLRSMHVWPLGVTAGEEAI